MRKTFLGIIISLSVPLFLFVNVWQSQRYMINYFEVRSLVRSQDELVLENKRLVNKVAELESPNRVFEYLNPDVELQKIGGGEIIRIEVIESNE
ncbi:MAG: hypothetical protein OCD02_22045 [Spirochaetaceae bacterium]